MKSLVLFDRFGNKDKRLYFVGPDGTQYILPAQTGLVPGLSLVSTTAQPVLPQQLSTAHVVTAPSQPQQVHVAAQVGI